MRMITIPTALTWQTNGELYAPQLRTADYIEARLNPITRRICGFRDELQLLLWSVLERHGVPAVMYSGGADSEMVIRELVSINRWPELHFIRFQDGSNQPDYEQALLFAESLNLRMHVHDHNVEAFINSGQHKELGCLYGTSDVALITVYKYARFLGKPIILGPELLLQKHQRDGKAVQDDEWSVIVGEHSFSAANFERHTGQPMYGELFFHSPELLTSLLAHPLMDKAMAAPGKISLAYQKNAILEQLLGYKFTAVRKRHGYEPIYPLFRRAVNEVKQALPFIQQEVRIPVDIARNQLKVNTR